MSNNNKHTYTPAEICKMFDISKSTLFRWEREGEISPPDRDLRQRRYYTQKHRAEIAELLMRRDYERMMRAEKEPGAEERMKALSEQISLRKFVHLQDRTGLYQLAEHETLSSDTIHQLLQEAQRYEPSSDVFREIIRVIYEKTVKSRE